MSKKKSVSGGVCSIVLMKARWCLQNKVRVLLYMTIIIIVIYLMMIKLNEMSYVWQTTVLGDILRPIHRQQCSIDHHHHNSKVTTMTTMTTTTSKKKRRIGLLLLYDDKSGDKAWNANLMERVMANRRAYCNRFDYDIIVGNEYIDRNRPAAWSKLLAMIHTLQKGAHDYVLYIDMDIVIMNMSISIDEYIDYAMSVNEHTDLIMTNDWNGPNTGVWIARNTDWTIWFLQEAWNQDHLVQKRSKDGIPHPFEYEQRAFHFLLNTMKWSSRNLPVYRGNSSDLAKHITLLPQCAFNSYSLHPLDFRGNRDESQYVDGDFLIHFAGKKGQIKINLMTHYLDLASSTTDYGN